MANQCPNCGKSIRAGAKFCGFCGYTVGKATPEVAASPPAGSVPPQQPRANQAKGGNFCPHCGKPNRSGVKFCSSCGKAFTSPAAAAASPPTPPPTSQTPAQPIKRKRSRIVTVGFLVGVLVIVCGSLVGIVYGFKLYEYVLGTPTPTITEVAIVVAEPEKPTATLTSPTPQPDVEATVTPQEPTQVGNTPTATPTKTLMPTITNTPGPVVFFEEDFTGGLDNWEQWRETGMPDPRIIMNDFLQLNGLDYDKVGITAKKLVPLVPGMMFEFEAEVDDLEDRFLYFDWYPGPTKRPVNKLSTLYLGINNLEVLLYYSQDPNNMRCNLDLDGTALRRYQIEFGPNWEVNLFVDDELQAECSGIFKPPDILEGHVTFSAWGRVDSFKITMP